MTHTKEVAFITGAASGIGKQIGETLLKEGKTVVFPTLIKKNWIRLLLTILKKAMTLLVLCAMSPKKKPSMLLLIRLLKNMVVLIFWLTTQAFNMLP